MLTRLNTVIYIFNSLHGLARRPNSSQVQSDNDIHRATSPALTIRILYPFVVDVYRPLKEWRRKELVKCVNEHPRRKTDRCDFNRLLAVAYRDFFQRKTIRPALQKLAYALSKRV
jgi:hypothetical protein